MRTVAATRTLGIILHELTTNATKYGALSTSSRHVDIAWQAHQTGCSEDFASWVESRGPEVTRPGSRVSG
jgi:two-component sensor histidine kinase